MCQRRRSIRVCHRPQSGGHVPFPSCEVCSHRLFAVSNLSVHRDVNEFDEETRISTGVVANSLEETSAFIAKAACSKGLEMGIIHEFHVFHFFPRYWVDEGVGLVLPRGRWPCLQCPCRISHVGTIYGERVAARKWAPSEVTGVAL
jgi:hypothetical protein